MSGISAVLACDARAGNLKIAGLTVMDRMVVAVHRAGCAPIVLAVDSPPALARAEALGIEISSAPTEDDAVAAALCRRDELRPDTAGRPQRTLLIESGMLLEPSDLKRVIEANGRLVRADGSSLPVKIAGSESRPVVAQGIAFPVTDAASARDAERKLWASLTSSADGLVDRFFNRPLSRPLSKLLVRTSVSPNLVSIVSILIGVAAAWFFASGSFVLGALVLQLSAVIDCVDGDLARVLFKESPLGKWLDLGGDQVVHFSVFAAIGMGVSRLDPSVPALTLGLSAALGVLLSFAVIVRALRQPVAQRSPLLNRLLDATANRDFSVLLLLLAIFGRMDLFLWMAGIGVHVFWLALLILLWRFTPPVALAFETPAANLHR